MEVRWGRKLELAGGRQYYDGAGIQVGGGGSAWVEPDDDCVFTGNGEEKVLVGRVLEMWEEEGSNMLKVCG